MAMQQSKVHFILGRFFSSFLQNCSTRDVHAKLEGEKWGEHAGKDVNNVKGLHARTSV